MPEDKYDQIIEDLEEVARSVPEFVRAVIADIKKARLIRTQLIEAGAITERYDEPQIPPNAFANMIIAEAAKKYLRIMRVPKPTDAIAGALVLGGLKHTARDFATTVRDTLGRYKEL